MGEYSEECLLTFLEKQSQLFDEPVAGTMEEAEAFLEDCMAVVCKDLEEVKEYFGDTEFQEEIKERGSYKKTQEKAHGQIETREYYQTERIRWLSQKKDWKGMKSIIMERKTLEKGGSQSIEHRYFISSLKEEIETVSRAVRGHWSIESMHWHLDVTFREDANTTIDKMAAQNQNIMRKWSLSILKIAEVSRHKLSMRKKRYVIGLRPIKHLEEVLNA